MAYLLTKGCIKPQGRTDVTTTTGPIISMRRATVAAKESGAGAPLKESGTSRCGAAGADGAAAAHCGRMDASLAFCAPRNLISSEPILSRT